MMRRFTGLMMAALLLATALAGCLDSMSSNAKPTVVMTVNPSGTVKVGQEVTFDATGSSDDGGSITYAWDFGDGHTSEAMTAKHTYNTIGTYTAELCISDGDFEICESVEMVVAAADAAEPSAEVASYKDDDCTGEAAGSGTHILAWICEEEMDVSDSTIDATTTIQLDGSQSAAGDASTYLVDHDWDLDITADSDGDGDPANDADLSGETVEWTNVNPGEYKVQLTVTDNQGFEDSAEMRVYVNYHGTWAEFTIDGNTSNNAIEVEFDFPVVYDEDAANTMRYTKVQVNYPKQDDYWGVAGGQSSNRLDLYVYNDTGEEVVNSTYLGDDDRTAGDCSDDDRCVELRVSTSHFRNYLDGAWRVDLVNEKVQDTTVKGFAILLEYK